MSASERKDLLEGEWLLVRHSGEIPEVALHASLYYLCEDPEGPRLRLAEDEITPLRAAALARYEEIILRDLDPANRDRSLFRGLRRAHHNWYRMVRFGASSGWGCDQFRATAAEALLHYLEVEQREVAVGERLSSVNCSAEALLTFALALDIDPAALPGNWSALCEQETVSRG